MLTWTDLENHVAAERLVRWSIHGKPPKADGRALYMTPRVHTQFTEAPWPGSEGENPRHTAERRSAMRAALQRFVDGKAVLLRRDLKELGSLVDKPLKPTMRGYWEFRSQGRMEETRLFGFFARPGAFVATAFKGRGEFRPNCPGDWDDQKKKCEGSWNDLFPTEDYYSALWPVLTKDHLANYLESSDGE